MRARNVFVNTIVINDWPTRALNCIREVMITETEVVSGIEVSLEG